MKKKRKMGRFLRKFGLILFVTGIVVGFNNCGSYRVDFNNLNSKSGGGGTTVGNPIQGVDMAFGAWGDTVAKSSWWDFLIPRAHAQSLDFWVSMCLHEIKFHPAGGGKYTEFKMELGEVELRPEGVDIGTYPVEPGQYERIEIEIKPDKCGKGRSVNLHNANGDFQTDDNAKMRFDGLFDYADGNVPLYVIVDALIVELQKITADNQIKREVDGFTGVVEQ